MKCKHCPGILIKMKEYYKFSSCSKYAEEYICILCRREAFKRPEK